MVPVLIVIVLLVALWRAFFYIPSLRQIWMVEKLPGPRYLPIIGPAYEMLFVKESEILGWMEKYVVTGWDRLAKAWLVGIPCVYVNNPQDIEVILSSTKLIDKGLEYSILSDWLQEGLLLSAGNKWHMRRKLLTPTFHFKILEDKTQTMYANARKFVDKLLEEDGQPFNPFKKISSCTLDVISEAAMGVSLNSQDNPTNEYVATIGRVTRASTYRLFHMVVSKPWIWAWTKIGDQSNKDIKELHRFTNKIITERREIYKETRADNTKSEDDVGERKKQAFLDKLLELDMSNEGQWKDSDIREEVDTFLFEGHDTTAALLLFALFELGQNPQVQELAFKEQYEIFGDDSRSATMEDLQNMNYLERFIKECLRLYPSVPYLARMLTEDLHLKDLPTIPRGTNMVVMPYFLHRDPRYFPEPEKFNPDRFMADECVNRHPFCYIPFSGGPRNCIGQRFAMIEIKTLLSTVLRFAKVEPVTDRSELILTIFIILRPVNPIFIRVIPRK
uniref:Cytochrome P450 4C1 n=1 Tax=Lygus hesperus TaxID=30085 RepID=A0A0K8T170_LYGHE